MDFDSLYGAYFMKLYSYVMTIVKDPHLAEEVTQETFFKALKTKSPCENRANEFTWLCAIAKRTCIDELRRQKKLAADPVEPPGQNSVRHGRARVPAEAVSPQNVEQLVEDQQLSLRLHQLLHALEEPYKEVFHLRTFGELSFQNIGQIFGKTEGWARVTYHRARLKLMERMENYESEKNVYKQQPGMRRHP